MKTFTKNKKRNTVQKPYSMQLAIILISAVWLFLSCEADLFNTGPKTTVNRTLNQFSYLLVEDIFDIELVQADTFGITIKAGSELIDNIELQHAGDSLYIYNTSKARWSRQYERPAIKVMFPTLKKITLHEPCNMQTSDTLHLDKLTIWAIADVTELEMQINANNLHLANASTSAGKYVLSGRVNYFATLIRGSGILEAGTLKAQGIHIRSRSIGDCHIWATSSLDVYIENTGKIYYLGAPTITNNTEETANQLIPLE